MLLSAARQALMDLIDPKMRGILWKVLGLSLLCLVALWFAIRSLFLWLAFPLLANLFPTMPEWTGWITFVLLIFAAVGLALGLGLLMAPVSAFVAGIFLDDAAEHIERLHYPDDPPGTALPVLTAMKEALKFLGIVILGNIFALALLLVPGVNLVAFFLVNGYLLGREFFEFAAMRFMGPAAARALRREKSLTVFLAGLVVAGFVAIPIVNLATPLFATAFMVHIVKRMREDAVV
ncbi:sulfate transporter family protein [Martelella sp. AD-3]|uniref:sulfate transporter family protein n=1 Tax=Martelella sp. AD-3 TaxID=686597 RepID=UPI00046326EA|nr:sulfate transporter family protein [Martelella sp. AD-3]AMM86490.1 cysteine biosynthesis protein CysZ [Martelella sp. AD-3]